MVVQIGESLIGEGQPCFITYEAGPTHDGIESAKRLVKVASQAGANAVKFQIIDPDRLVADKSILFSYKVLIDRDQELTEEVEEPLYNILRRRYLAVEEWKELKSYADSLGLAFFCTICFEEDVSLMQELQCDSIKIASSDINHYPLIRLAARTGMCIQIDTGNATIGEVEMAVDTIRAEGNERIIIHHCPSGYPARLPSIYLNMITTLKQMFPYPIAFSDHTPGWEMDVAALALGANLLEKTITEDRMIRSVEHIFSLEPEDMKKFIKIIRNVEIALGENRRTFEGESSHSRKKYRRSIFLKMDVRAGQKLKDIQIDFRRPGYGLEPAMYEKLQDLEFRNDLPGGHMLTIGDFLE